MKSLIVLLGLATVVLAQHQQQQQYTTPVPILKQINRHNEDGSYSYGYEGADGSFKIETKHQNGEVFGKYGYVDETGKVREVEYGASKRGFEPQGTDINVPPSTVDNNQYDAARPLAEGEEDDGQYREDPSIYYKDDRYNSKPAYKTPSYQPVQQQQYYQPTAAPVVQQQPQHRFQYQAEQQPRYYQQPQTTYQSTYQQPQARYQQHHPAATNYDLNTGSYSLSYTG